MCWVLLEASVGSRNSPSAFRSYIPTDRRRKWPESSAFGYSAVGRIIGVPDDNSYFPGTLSPVKHSQYLPFTLERRGSRHGHQDIIGESMVALEGACSQNTLKNKRLEHQTHRQERNFID
jgi:hypothetical protein